MYGAAWSSCVHGDEVLVTKEGTKRSTANQARNRVKEFMQVIWINEKREDSGLSLVIYSVTDVGLLRGLSHEER